MSTPRKRTSYSDSGSSAAQAGQQPTPHLLSRPHHDGSELFVPKEVPQLGDTVPVRVRVPASFGDDAVHVRVLRNGEPGYARAKPDGTSEGVRWFAADVEVHNPVTLYRFVLHGDDGYEWLNGVGQHSRDITDASDFRLSVYGGAPRWARDAVVYQIFPDRFARSGTERPMPAWAEPANWDDPVDGERPHAPLQFYGGDLLGIEQRLDYLADLGVGTVYLTPIFPGESKHRYNATAFRKIDPLLGGDEALASLSKAVHARGMRIIGDFTTNHTGDTHQWFQCALANRTSVEAGYYYWCKEAPGYIGWYDEPTLPKLNYNGTGLLERMALSENSVTARWLKEPFSLDGWRIDVANMTGRYAADDFARDVARAMRQTMSKIKADSVLIAEHNFDASADLVGDGWQGTMNYAGFMRPEWTWLADPKSPVTTFLGMPNTIPVRSGSSVVATMREVLSTVSWPTALSVWNSLDTHDTPRLPEVTCDSTLDRVGMALLYTYPGTPMMFAGLEVGAGGLNGEFGRIPMPWHKPEAFQTPTFRAVRSLIHLRNQVRALREGGMRWVVVHDDALAFLRETADERILVVVSRAPWPGSGTPRLSPCGWPDPREHIWGSRSGGQWAWTRGAWQWSRCPGLEDCVGGRAEGDAIWKRLNCFQACGNPAPWAKVSAQQFFAVKIINRPAYPLCVSERTANDYTTP